MDDERSAHAASRTNGEFRARRGRIDQTEQVRRAAVRRNITGRERRCLEPHCIVQRCTRNEIDTAMQYDQPRATNAVTDLMVREPKFQKLLTCDEAGL